MPKERAGNIEAPGQIKNVKRKIIAPMANRKRSCRLRRRAAGVALGWNLRREPVSIFDAWQTNLSGKESSTYLCGDIEYVSLLDLGYPFEYAFALE
jgi:hypothetical protein